MEQIYIELGLHIKFHIVDQRLDDIKYWKKEVDDKLDAIKIEIDSLLAFRNRIDKAIDACKEPLHIAQQCLFNRYMIVYIRGTYQQLFQGNNSHRDLHYVYT